MDESNDRISSVVPSFGSVLLLPYSLFLTVHPFVLMSYAKSYFSPSKLTLIFFLLFIIPIQAGIVGCSSLPDNSQRTVSSHLPFKASGELVERLLPDIQKNPDMTGVYLLHDGKDAFVARLALTEKAQHSIDAQYYIWHDDVTGRLLLRSMYQAADRGVRVRLLLDDNVTLGMDYILSKFNAHPNIEVRLFNPYVQRKFRSISYLTDTVRINRRMHNKSFTVDSLVSVIGGRNVGDEYFSVDHDLIFADLDVSVIGKVVPEIQTDFDKYWASESSYPLERIAKPNLFTPKETLQIQQPDTANINQQIITTTEAAIPIKYDKASKKFLLNLFETKYPEYLADPDYPLFVWAKARYFSDPPSKIKQGQNFDYNDSVIAKLAPFIASTEQQLLIVSPYFIPTKEGTKYLVAMARQGKRVIILTNSLAATDVEIVHAGYQKYRKELLAAGVELYEFKPNPRNDQYNKKGYRKKYKDDYDVNSILPEEDGSLHAKAFAVDDKYLFVGSPNLDPRSATLNTELGVVFESRILTAAINKAFEQNKNVVNYQLELSPQGKIEWHTIENGEKVVYYHEPKSELTDRVLANLLSMLPWLDDWL